MTVDVVSLQKMEMLSSSLRTAHSWFGRWSAQFSSRYHHKHSAAIPGRSKEALSGHFVHCPAICTQHSEISSWSNLRTAWCWLEVQMALWELENAALGPPSLDQTLNTEARLGHCELHPTAAEQDYSNFWPFTFTVTKAPQEHYPKAVYINLKLHDVENSELTLGWLSRKLAWVDAQVLRLCGWSCRPLLHCWRDTG